MPRLTCGGRELTLAPGELVLDALQNAGLPVTSSCRAGACQSCLVRASAGTVPAAAQRGLRESLRMQGYFLACQATLESDLEVSLGGAAELEVPARLSGVEHLAADVLRVTLKPEREFSYRAGQFLTLVRDDGVARAYSVASLPSDPGGLELHVRVLPGGAMSSWLASPTALGAKLRIRGPAGDCFYLPEKPEEPLLLAGAGTGLAPLWGILRDALRAGHRGPIELWHGARSVDGLYLRQELAALAAEHANVTYRACVLQGSAGGDVTQGRLDDALLASAPSFAGRRVYLCGDAGLVQQLRRQVFMKGAASHSIHADAFVGSAPAA